MPARTGDALIGRLCSKTDTTIKALAISSQVRLKALPGSGYDLSQGQVGLPAICAYVASRRLGNGDVTEKMAHIASCLSMNVFLTTTETVERILDALEVKEKRVTYEQLMEEYKLGDEKWCIEEIISTLSEKSVLHGQFEPQKPLVVCATIWWTSHFFQIPGVPYTPLMDKYNLDPREFCAYLDLCDEHCDGLKKTWTKHFCLDEMKERNENFVEFPSPPPTYKRRAAPAPAPTVALDESASAPVKKKRNRKPKGPWFYVVSEDEDERAAKKKPQDILDDFDDSAGKRRTRSSVSAARSVQPPTKRQKLEGAQSVSAPVPSDLAPLPAPNSAQSNASSSSLPKSRVTRSASAATGGPEPLPLPPLRRNKRRPTLVQAGLSEPEFRRYASAGPDRDDHDTVMMESPPSDADVPVAEESEEEVESVKMEVDTSNETKIRTTTIRRRYRPVFQDRVEWDMRDPWSERLLAKGHDALVAMASKYPDAAWARAVIADS